MRREINELPAAERMWDEEYEAWDHRMDIDAEIEAKLLDRQEAADRELVELLHQATANTYGAPPEVRGELIVAEMRRLLPHELPTRYQVRIGRGGRPPGTLFEPCSRCHRPTSAPPSSSS
jgi:hypothetical protein